MKKTTVYTFEQIDVENALAAYFKERKSVSVLLDCSNDQYCFGVPVTHEIIISACVASLNLGAGMSSKSHLLWADGKITVTVTVGG